MGKHSLDRKRRKRREKRKKHRLEKARHRQLNESSEEFEKTITQTGCGRPRGTSPAVHESTFLI